MAARKTPIAERISNAFTPGMRYHDLERAVFPEDVYPRAFNYKADGGPPGCRMALMAALRRLGYRVVYDRHGTALVIGGPANETRN